MRGSLVGRTIADGRYEIIALLGEGGMGAVYQARQVAMDRMVALKLIRGEAIKSSEAVARFQREMKLTSKIEHPNTIRVYDFGSWGGQLYLTMELVRGKTLTQVIAEHGRLELPRIVRIATQIARALAAAHSEGVIHRDLKPDNVMLLEQYGEADVVKVLDFGIAKSLGDEDVNMTEEGAVIGTPAYMSVEQAMGTWVDARSDLYTLGVMLFEMAAGRVPFQAPSMTAMLVAHASEPAPPLRRFALDVHPGLNALVDELLRKDPATRPATARIVEQRLESLVAHPQAEVMTVRSGRGRVQPSGRGGILVAVFAVLVVGGGIVAAVVSEPEAEPPKAEPPKAERPKVEPPKAELPKAEPPKAPVEPPRIDPVLQARLDKVRDKLAALDDPSAPARCAPEAVATAGEAILVARAVLPDDVAAALAAATQAVTACPTWAAAHNVRGNALQKQGQLADAGKAYLEAIALDASYDTPRFNLGVLQLRQQDVAAIATFTELIARRPDFPDAHKSRAQAFLTAKRYEDGLADLEESVRRQPDDGTAWLIIGQLREKLARPAAKAAYCKAKALQVEGAAAHCGG